MDKERTVKVIVLILILLFLCNAIGIPLNICDDIEYVIDAETVEEIGCDQECIDAWATVHARETEIAK